MVKGTGAEDGAGALRPLNPPQLVRVETVGNGRPVRVIEGRRRWKVKAVQDVWRVEDEWWRDRPLSRTYFEVVLEDGMRMTVYVDLVGQEWFRQQYSQ